MLSIQELGLSIMGDHPKSFYILGGKEFGIKERYIDMLTTTIGERVEYSTVSEVISLFTQNHLIPLIPHVYVVRYDSSFVSSITSDLTNRILNMQIIGVVVLIYESDKDVNKLNKFFPDNTASIDTVDPKHLVKYLKTDFPKLDEKILAKVVPLVTDYYNAKNVCRCLCSIMDTKKFPVEHLLPYFGVNTTSSELDIQLSFANRDFVGFHKLIGSFEGEMQSILYLMLRTLGELDKCMDNKYADSPLKKCVDHWSRSDVYNMFNHVYQMLVAIRGGASINIEDALIYLSALFRFEHIPMVEALS